jgi:hypothetical protein
VSRQGGAGADFGTREEKGGRDRRGDLGCFYEAAALANTREREGENGEEDSEPVIYQDCWKQFFVLFCKLYG